MHSSVLSPEICTATVDNIENVLGTILREKGENGYACLYNAANGALPPTSQEH
jgi:hypothetical protein